MAAATSSSCNDDENFSFLTNMGKEKECIWINNENRRNKYCHRDRIANNCPASCGLCSTASDVAFDVPIMSSSDVTSCKDSDDFQWKNNEKKTCAWIGRSDDRREVLCQNAKVSQACPQTCRMCCADDETFEFAPSSTRSKMRSCTWLSLNPWRQTQFCDTIYQGVVIATKCPTSCGICTAAAATTADHPMPSVAPTVIGDEEEVQVDEIQGTTSSYISPESSLNVPTTSFPSPFPSPPPTRTADDHDSEDPTVECRVDITLVTSFDYLTVKNRASGEICSPSSRFCEYMSNYTNDTVSIRNASSSTYDVKIVSEEDGITAGKLSLDVNGVPRIRESWNNNENVPV
eukprot:CAMPEP_0176492668 /NCGR_PEP_ID=MMETSP0200_2-20121128/9131_1 /TAXON_ID=947934 /ORGANISM="Chaetoceros sp., Strain GSL56" /LENGTH=345 /DNA_ID=CAMNT_0017890265 /DNA_START=59 /DNA_END=1092 /DNA_ORIENTATION=+